MEGRRDKCFLDRGPATIELSFGISLRDDAANRWIKSMRTVTLTSANHEFLRLIEEVENGGTFLITRHGRPVARLVPYLADKTADPRWMVAYRRMVVRLKEGASLGGLGVEREDLHGR